MPGLPKTDAYKLAGEIALQLASNPTFKPFGVGSITSGAEDRAKADAIYLSTLINTLGESLTDTDSAYG